MKKITLLFLLLFSFSCVNAYWLDVPVLTSEQIKDGKLTISWTVGEGVDYYEILLFKKYKVAETDSLVLFDSNFDYVESTGTMKEHENPYPSILWQEVPGFPGWTVRNPVFMDKAMGIDAFMNFEGSDNDDPFGAAYILSPEYDLTAVKDQSLHIQCDMANEASSVSGGLALYTFSYEEDFTPGYSLVPGQMVICDNLSNQKWKHFESSLKGDMWCNNTRMSVYGRGYSSLWIDNLKVSVVLEAGNEMPIPVKQIEVKDTVCTIDMSELAESDKYYAYQIRAVDLYSDNSINAYSQYSKMKYVGVASGIQDMEQEENSAIINCMDGMLRISDAEGMSVTVTTLDGSVIYNGIGDVTIPVSCGFYIVKVGNKVVKIAC